MSVHEIIRLDIVGNFEVGKVVSTIGKNRLGTYIRHLSNNVANYKGW